MLDGDNIREIEQLGIDWMGFIFYARSPRNVKLKPSYLPKHCKRVGVFVDMPINEVIKKALEYELGYIQLHGKENVEYCKKLRNQLDVSTKIIKCIHISKSDDIYQTSEYEYLVDYFLFENRCAQHGGSGMKFDWTYLSNYNGEKPFILSGGIGPSDTSVISKISHPRFAGIDLNSLFETNPGHKNAELLKTFIKRLENEQNQQTIQR